MKKFRFIGNPNGYNDVSVFKSTYNENESFTISITRTIVEWIEFYPEDWEEVFEDESPWISVLYELPKHDQEVFAVDEFEEYHACKYDSFWGFVQDEKKIRPTHWMPLPKLPTNE